MVSVRARTPAFKPSSVCRSCSGSRSVLDADRGRSECFDCAGTGRVIRQKEESVYFQATQGADLLDIGGPLADFVNLQLRTFTDLEGGSVVIWEVGGKGAPRVVAVLQPGRGGESVVWWMGEV